MVHVILHVWTVDQGVSDNLNYSLEPVWIQNQFALINHNNQNYDTFCKKKSLSVFNGAPSNTFQLYKGRYLCVILLCTSPILINMKSLLTSMLSLWVTKYVRDCQALGLLIFILVLLLLFPLLSIVLLLLPLTSDTHTTTTVTFHCSG